MICFCFLVIEILFLGIMTSLGTREPHFLLASFLIILFSLSYAIYIYTSSKYKNVCRILLAGYLFRIALLFWDLYGRSIYILPSSAMDTEGYWYGSVLYAKGLYVKDIALKIFGSFVWLCGEQRLFIQFLLLMTSVFTFHVVFKILKELKIPDEYITPAIFLIAMLPNYAIQSSIFLKEAVPAMFVGISLLFFVRWYKCEGEANFYYAVFFALTASLFHSGTFTAAASYVFIRIVYDNKTNKYNFTFKTIITGLCLTALAVFIFNSSLGDILFAKVKGVKSINAIDSGVDWDRSASGYARYVGDSSSITNIIIYTPLRIIFFLFCPLPFQIRGFQDLLAMLFGSFFYMYTYYKAIIYIAHKGKYRNLAIILIVMGLMAAFVIGWGRPNMGTAIRHRDKMIVCYIVLLAISLTDRKYSSDKK